MWTGGIANTLVIRHDQTGIQNGWIAANLGATPMTPLPRPLSRRRSGFTLAELLVVILIVGILIGLLVPAIAAAVRAAKDAQVAAEIQNIQTALADFKNRYGEYPPSRIILRNDGNYDITNPINARTVRAMRKYFPRAVAYFGTTGVNSSIHWGGWDNTMVDASGNFTLNHNAYLLEGHQCLVFFLGGTPTATISSTSVSTALNGFSKDPANPFFPPPGTATNGAVAGGVVPNAVCGANRTTPLFEFAPSRLVTIRNPNSVIVPTTTTDLFASYLDPINNGNPAIPYAYFSAYGSNGYDPNDDNRGETALNSNLNYSQTFNYAGSPVTSLQPNPYSNGNPISNTPNWMNPQSFQIISAGRDGIWGPGGGLEANASEKLPTYPADPAGFGVLRQNERDNITNFTQGKIE